MIQLSSFDSTIFSRTLLQHPFYLKWSKGELTLQDLQFYAKEYFHLVQAIPGIVERVKDQVTDETLKVKIAENEAEETEHIALWKRFAKSLGINEQELMNHVPSQKTMLAVRSLEELASSSAEQGIAAMYALELELPKIAQTKKDGLAAFYGLSSDDATCYFDEHLKEEEHLKVWRAFEIDEVSGTSAVETSLQSQHQVLDAVCEARGIACHC